LPLCFSFTEYSGPMYLVLWIPQGSVLGLLLFSFCVVDISNVVTQHSPQLHKYTNDCLLYVSATVLNEASMIITRLCHCVAVSHWLSASRLCLNWAETVLKLLIWFVWRQQLDRISEHRCSTTVVMSHNCGFHVGLRCDSEQSSHHVGTCQFCNTAVCQLRPVMWSTANRVVVVGDAVKTVIHVFVLLCFDCCDCLLYGISDVLL